MGMEIKSENEDEDGMETRWLCGWGRSRGWRGIEKTGKGMEMGRWICKKRGVEVGIGWI